MPDEKPRRLTAEDPIDLATLQEFEELDSSRYELGAQLLNLEQERIRLLAAAHQVDQQRQRLFERSLVERGLEPTTRVQIDSKTGLITVLGQKSPE